MLLCVAVRRGGLGVVQSLGLGRSDPILPREGPTRAHSSPRCWQWNKVGAVRTPTEPKKGIPRVLDPGLKQGLLCHLPAGENPHWHSTRTHLESSISAWFSRIGLPKIHTVHSTKYIYGLAININGRQCRYILHISLVTLCNIDFAVTTLQLQGTRQHSEAIKKKPTADRCPPAFRIEGDFRPSLPCWNRDATANADR